MEIELINQLEEEENELDEKVIIEWIINHPIIRQKIEEKSSFDSNRKLIIDENFKELFNELQNRIKDHIIEDEGIKSIFEETKVQFERGEISEEDYLYIKATFDNFEKAVIILQQLQEKDYYNISQKGTPLRIITMPSSGGFETLLDENLKDMHDYIEVIDTNMTKLETVLKEQHAARGDISYLTTRKQANGLHNEDGHLVMKDAGKSRDLRILFVRYDPHTVVVLGATRGHPTGNKNIDDNSRRSFYESREQLWEDYITTQKATLNEEELERLITSLEEDYKGFRNRMFLELTKSNMTTEIEKFMDKLSQKVKGDK